jgi:plasmid stabilization system protein ParE
VARQIDWSPKATADLEAICERISRDSEFYARLFATRVTAAVERLACFPKLGRVVPEYGREDLREIIYQRYRIVYRLRGEGVEIAAVCHGSRPLGEAHEVLGTDGAES